MTTWEDLDALASLADPVRRQAYQVVAGGTGPVGRDEVAESLGVGRTLAAFHLDKLVAAGLLETSYARRSGKTGPGAGRPAKLYHLAAAERAVSVPPRAYRTAAEMLAEALELAGAENLLYEVAQRHGRSSESADVPELLASRGYEPAPLSALDGAALDGAGPGEVGSDASSLGGPDRLELRNCPFHQLAEQFPPLVCGMNLATINGLIEGRGWTARMDPAPGRCCVTLSKNKSD